MQSGPKPAQPEQRPPVFFLDRSLGRRLVAEAIAARGFAALPMAEVYPNGQDQRIPDPQWMMHADREGWTAITKDRALIRDHADTLAETTLRLFLIPNANLSGSAMVERLMANWDAITRRARSPGPFAYSVLPGGLVRRWPRG